MKRIIKRIFSVGVCLLAGVSFGFLGFLYISSQNSEPVKKTESEIPYSYVPDNAGVMFEFYEEKIYAHLDFENEKISLIFANNADTSDGYIYGYRIDYTVKANSILAAGVIDSVGGIELTVNGETLRYTGVQISDLLSVTPENETVKRQIITVFFEKVAQIGLAKNDFVYIIENSETDLTVPDCYYWNENIKELAENAVILN